MKKRILIRIGSLRHGGAEKVLITFLKNLSPDKYEIDLLLNLYSGKYLKDVPSWINIYYLNKGEMIITNRLQDLPIKSFRVVYQAILKKYPKLVYKHILKDKKYDIEFAAIHSITDEILSSPQKSSKKIVWIHNDLSKLPEYTENKLRKLFEFDKILVISDKINKFFLELASSKEEKNKIVRIYNPIDTDEINRLSKVNISIKKATSIPVFLSIGTISKQKGFDRLLKAHKRLLEEGFLHHIWILGDGYISELSKLINELNISASVILLGYKENPYPYFVEADFYILSSRYEGYPTVLFEAIVLKKPIIATDVSGVREMLDDGELGCITENSEVGIYEGMKSFLENDKIVSKYNQAIKSKSLPFELNKVTQSIEDVFIID